MDYRKIKGVTHFVYDDIDEFKKQKKGIKPKYWKDDPQEGDWVKSDDGGIVQILKKNNISHPSDRKNWKAHKGYVRTVVGTFLLNDKTEMDTDFDLHPNRYTFSKSLKQSNENFKKRKNITKKEKLFATEVIVGKDAISAVQNVYKENDFNKAKKKAVLLLKQERIMNEVEKGVVDIAKGLGIDHEYVLRRLKSLADTGEEENVVLQSLKELGKIIGTSTPAIKKDIGVVGMFQGFSPKQLEQAERKELTEGEK
jgi:tRNA-binding EMAP/Myf-like protein